MHPYATDSNERGVVPFFLAAFAIGAAWGLAWLLRYLSLEVPWWVDAPSAVGFYGLQYSLFDAKLWRLPILRRIGIVNIPDLRGRWKGQVATSFDKYAAKHDVEVEIDQSWTKLKLSLRGKDSVSESLAATLLTNDAKKPILSYQYRNDPLPHAKDQMQIHYGTARLTLSESRSLEGEYYSGRGRQNFGSIHLTKAASS